MYILGEDPVMTDPDLNHVHECFAACEFIVLQEIFPSETAGYADVLLPAASFVEKDGTFTNTERRIQRVHAAFNPVGQARPTGRRFRPWRSGCSRSRAGEPSGPTRAGSTRHRPQIMDEIAALTPSYVGRQLSSGWTGASSCTGR